MIRPPAPLWLIDADAERLSVALRAVRRLGHTLASAASIEDARGRTGKQTPAVVLVSLEIWRTAGAPWLRALQERGARTRFVVFGDDRVERDRDRLVEEGVQAILRWPLSTAELDACVDEQLEAADNEAQRPSDGVDRRKVSGEYLAAAGSPTMTYSSLPAVGDRSPHPAMREAVRELAEELRAGRVRIQGVSASAVDLQRVLADHRTSLTAIVQHVERDPQLASAVIRASNAAQYRGRGVVTNLADAGRRLGVRRLAEVSQMEAVRGVFSSKDRGWTKLLTAMRRNTLCTAYAARHVAERMRDTQASTVYTMGLFHNLGELLVLDLYQRLGLDAPVEGVAAGALRADMDSQHTALGALLLKSWNMPAPLVAVAFAHQDPSIYPSGTPVNRHCWMVAGAYHAMSALAPYKDEHREAPGLSACATALGQEVALFEEAAAKANEWWTQGQPAGKDQAPPAVPPPGSAASEPAADPSPPPETPVTEG